MQYIEFLISDSQLAFLNQQNETALDLANQAISVDGKNPEDKQMARLHGHLMMDFIGYQKGVPAKKKRMKQSLHQGIVDDVKSAIASAAD